MKRNRWMILAAGSLLLLGACANVGAMRESDGSTQAAVLEAEDSGLVQEEAERQTEQPVEASAGPEETSTLDFQTDPSQATVTEGTQEYRDFLLDNVLHSANDGDIHYSVYIPDSYDGSEPYAVFFTVPGYEGLYFQGVGENLYSENFAFEAKNYNSKMIIVAPSFPTGEKHRPDRPSPWWSIFSATITLIRKRSMRKATPAAESHVPGDGNAAGAFCRVSAVQLPVGRRV